MSLKDRFKSETIQMHKALEDQYPFNQLMIQDDILKTSNDAILCFKLMFLSFVKLNKKKHDFYKETFEILYSYKAYLNDKILDLDPNDNHYHLEYLFLGSRMGNQLLVNKNPAINEVENSKYFQLPLPSDLWADFISRLNKVEGTEVQDLLVQRAKDSFKELINYGKLVELT